ncbi:RNA polymerase subunit sigma [Pseudomonas sp. P66]|uniref:RNA polymerase subunit sigma n=1 Tax=Pseudomonas arcuscaelestis TaxID=2710591 RepID=A0ABS2BZ72_9PSED|nr:sigma factor-like helix-turn-helix DNA-binding protein [Pseudomonas arcuscaelestis]MBM5458922.1 RNA polymerase subunit sigma [Pseudomonas arcuscaelestis]
MSNVAIKYSNTLPSAPEARLGLGFTLPTQMPPFPLLDGPKGLLTARNEQDLGYRILLGQLDRVRALAVDTGIVSAMVKEIWDAMGEKDNVDKAVALIYHEGAWLRVGTLPEGDYSDKKVRKAAKAIADEEFATLVRRKLNGIQTLISELRGYATEGMDGTLFSSAVRDELRQKLSEILPYDYILNRAVDQFRANCKELTSRTRDLIKFICEEVRIPKVKAEGIISGNWTSPKLIPALLISGGYELKLFPPAAMKNLRLGITQRQKAILEAASTGEAPAAEILAAWSVFMRVDRDIEKCADIFTKANVRLVEQQVGRFRFSDSQIVRSAANMGLTRAVYRFAPEMGFRFSTIAIQWIQVSINRDLVDQESIRLPEGMHKQLRLIKDKLQLNPNESIQSLAKATKLDEDLVRDLVHLVGSRTSIDSTFQESGSADTDGLHEMLADTNNDFMSEIEEESTRNFVNETLGQVLNEREIFVMMNRYGMGDSQEMTLAELAAIMSLSKERVRQIEMQAIGKIRDSAFAESLFEMWGDM